MDTNYQEQSHKKRIHNWANTLSIAILSAGIIIIPFLEIITPLIFGGKTFFGRSTDYRFVIFVIYWTILSLILFALLIFVQRITNKTLVFDPIIKLDYGSRMLFVSIILGFSIALIYFFNNVFGSINLSDWEMVINDPFPFYNPVGVDFRFGVYWFGEKLIRFENIYIDSPSIYPPFSNILFLPMQLLSENAAYIVLTFILLISNIATMMITTILIKDVFMSKLRIEQQLINLYSLLIFFLMLFYTLSSYGFIFSIERGNFDSIAIFFCMLSIYLTIKKPNSLWLQVLFLSIATHLKIYPAALFLVLFVKHGKKLIVPSLIINFLLLVSLGLKNAMLYINIIKHYSLSPGIWIGNHSGYSFAYELIDVFSEYRHLLPYLRWSFLIIPLIVWIISSALSIKLLKNDIRILYLTMVSIPLMCLLPTVSHDYKLVILSVPLLIMIAILIYKIVEMSKFLDYLHLISILCCAWLMGRSYVLYQNAGVFINNKYTTILTLAILMIPGIFTLRDLQMKNLIYENQY